MSIDFAALRLDGIYQQNTNNDLMLRVKIPAGLLSSEQAEKLADIADGFARSQLHLTIRGSIEFHRLRYEQLEQIMPMLAAVGLTTRGACGGAVRGIVCSTSFAPGFAIVQRLARNLQRHFAGNPHFEGLPKKFKIGVEAGYAGARHLIQDFAIVCTDAATPRFDVWCAGGLGREPQPAFCFARDLDEAALLPLIEAVVRVYAGKTPAGKRLKHLLRNIGEDGFRAAVQEQLKDNPAPALRPSVAGTLVSTVAGVITLPIFAGEMSATTLRQAAALARIYCTGYFAVTADQDLAFPVSDTATEAALRAALRKQKLITDQTTITCRVCPGNHECRMGLAATRDLARTVLAHLADSPLANRTFAISGCPNSCSQPQLADIGILTRRLERDATGERSPRFDLLQRKGDHFGATVQSDLDAEQLLTALCRLSA